VSPEVLLGLDVGTTGVKAVAISPDGRVLASTSESYSLSTPRPGWAEQDPDAVSYTQRTLPTICSV
jgi:xylulokinase